MLNCRTLLCLVLLISIISCSEDLDYVSVDILPLSSIEYTETLDGVTTTEIFDEGATFRFEDVREFPEDSCGLFKSGIRMTEERENDYIRSIVLFYWSHVSPEQVEDNQVLFHDLEDFEQHMTQFYEVHNLLDPCVLPENRTGILISDIESQLPSLNFSTIETGETPDYTLQRIVYNDLGYLLLDAVFDYTAKRVSNAGVELQTDFVPTQVKVKHAIRFPELDK